MLSTTHGFLFIHRGKTGGNSISEALLPFSDDQKMVRGTQDGVNRFDVENPVYKTRKHFGLAQYAEVVPAEVLDGLYKFSTLRNPFDRLVSAYFSPHRITEGVVNGFNREQFRELIESQKGMREFICLRPDGPLTADIQTLMRFESLEEDFGRVTCALGLGQLPLQHRNRAERQDYRIYYDAELRALVETKFGEELAFGNYSF
jgi:hypothetical protein